jgi:hypothetical protein
MHLRSSTMRWPLMFVLLVSAECRAAMEVTATSSATVLATGPREGENGKRYFNVQGKAAERYASFGIIDFTLPGPEKLGKVKAATLKLVQSVPRFAKDGKFKVYLITDASKKETDAAQLKFDVAAGDGLGEQLGAKQPLGSGEFKKVETGHLSTYPLTLDEAQREVLARGGKVRLVVVPDGDDVAATYFGSGSTEEAQRPKLVVDVEP